jgi:hypothetical protein
MFPGGNVKEGYFELNVFKGPCKNILTSYFIVSNDQMLRQNRTNSMTGMKQDSYP